MNTIEREELEAKLGVVRIVEVLPIGYYQSGHLPGAVHLPLEGLESRAPVVIPDRDGEVALYCSGPTCSSSHQAAERLARIGYRAVRVFVGGKAAWKDARLAFEVSR